jgi:hypothetical protein
MMNNGQVVETGTHDELLALRGEYYKLWSTQTGEINVGEEESEETGILEKGPEETRIAEKDGASAENKKTNALDEEGVITYE